MKKKKISTWVFVLAAVSLFQVWTVVSQYSEPTPLAYALFIIPAVLILIAVFLRISGKREQAEAERIAEEERIQQEEARRRSEEEEKRRRQEEAEERRKAREMMELQQAAFLDSIPAADIVVSETPAKKLSAGVVDSLPFSWVNSRSTLDSLCDFVAIDVETTGLSPSNAEIVDVAAIRFRGFKPVMKFQTLCRPLRGTTLDSENINGITEEMLEEEPTFQQIALSLKDFIGGDNIVGQNLGFDLKFIIKYGVDVTAEKRKYFDTLRIAQRTLRKPEDVDNYKLGTLAAYYGIPLFGAHRALDDCYAAGRLFEELSRARAGQ